MPKGNGVFIQGDLMGVEPMGESVHRKANVYVGGDQVISVTLFGKKAEGKVHPAVADLAKLADTRSTVCLQAKYEPARGNFDAGFSFVGLVPVGQ